MAVSQPSSWSDVPEDLIQYTFAELAKSDDPQALLLALNDSAPEVYYAVYERFLRERALIDSNAFHEYCFRNEDGTFRHQPQFHKEWNMVWDMGPSRFLILAPRDHSKTTQASQRAVYELGKNPNTRIKVVTAADDLANAVLGSVAEIVEKNKYVREIFPHLIPDKSRSWTQHRLFVQRSMVGLKDPSVESLSVLATGAGGRADIILFDDIVDYRNAVQQPATREQVRGSFFEVWLNILEPGGRAWILGTRWHEADLYGELEELCARPGSGWVLWKKPCVVKVKKEVGYIDDETGERKVRTVAERRPLWHERFTMEYLQAKKAELPASSWASQWMLRIVSEEDGGFVPPVWVEDARIQDIPEAWPRFVGVDLASSMTKRGAFTVFYVAALSPEGHRLPIEIIRGKFRWGQICDLILRCWFKHKPRQIRVENNVFQRAVEQHFKDKYPYIPVKGHTTGANKADPAVGLPSLQHEFELGLWRVWMPEPNLQVSNVWTTWVEELLAYPAGKFSDTVMANWFCQTAIREQEAVGKVRIREFSLENTEANMQAIDEQERELYDAHMPQNAEMDEEVRGAIIDIERALAQQDQNRASVEQVVHLAEFMATTQDCVDVPMCAEIVGMAEEQVVTMLHESDKFTVAGNVFTLVEGQAS